MKSLMDILNPKSWGSNLIRASSDQSTERTLKIYRRTSGEPWLVGMLFRDQGEFVFRYDPEYDKVPISAFPEIDMEYRSESLWPFFAVRIPPMEREDVREEISNLSLEKDQVIEILGSIAKVSVTNPYVFKLGG